MLVWSDAMWEASSSQPAQGGFVIRLPASNGEPPVTLYSRHVTPPDVIKRFEPGKKQYIGQLELLYAVAVYTSAPEALANRRVIHFIDNTSAIAGLVKGYSRAIDSGKIVNAFHAFNAGLRSEPFFEYVRSKANIADLPSRGEMRELKRLLLEAGCFGKIKRIECHLPSVDEWDDLAFEWMEKGRRKRENSSGNRSSRSQKRKRKESL